MKIAFLKFPSYQTSRLNNFEGKANIGAYVVMDVLKRHHISCDIVSIKEVYNYNIILISFTSVWDVISFARHVFNKKQWINRKFTVIAGGFGMQSHSNLEDLIDYAYYGRFECSDIKAITSLNSVYLFKSTFKGEVILNKGTELYPHEIIVNGFKWKESLIGCPKKCLFCSYSHTRNYLTLKSNHEFNFYNKKTSVELDFWNYKNYNNQPNVTMAIDGWSERLRYSMNKKISNELIKKAFIYISNTTACKAVRIKLYNIEGYENEGLNDMNEFIQTMLSIIPFLKTRLFIIIHSTPLFPSRFTKVESYPISFNLNLHKRKSFCKYIKNEKLIIEDDNYNISDIVNREGVIALYGKKQDFEIIIKDSEYKRLNVSDKLKYLNYERAI
jgi:hypothetical protein